MNRESKLQNIALEIIYQEEFLPKEDFEKRILQTFNNKYNPKIKATQEEATNIIGSLNGNFLEQTRYLDDSYAYSLNESGEIHYLTLVK